MTQTLRIDGVDLDTLERQRRLIEQAVDTVITSEHEFTVVFSSKQFDALQSLMNMLDEWSDERSYEQEELERTFEHVIWSIQND